MNTGIMAIALFGALSFALLTAAGLLFGRLLLRRLGARDDLSPVTRQHIDLFQGGKLPEGSVEIAKIRFRNLLERGDVPAVNASLRAGMEFAVRVRALTEIGGQACANVLERHLQRRHTRDAMEQTWYWIDLAGGLRTLNRDQSLPNLLRCFETAAEFPLNHFLAAEIVSFIGFAGYLHQPDHPLTRSALRVLHRALEGLRFGIQPHLLAEARLGEVLEQLWDHRPDKVSAMVVRVFAEALRVLRRAPHAETAFEDDDADAEAFHWQVSRIAALEPLLEDYLADAAVPLCVALGKTNGPAQADILRALADLRAEAASALMPLLENPEFEHGELAVSVLTWSKDPRVAGFLRRWMLKNVAVVRRGRKRRAAEPPRKPSLPARLPYQAVLRALRGHPSAETEIFLLLAARDWDPSFRAAAAASFGWWEPVHRDAVLLALQSLRGDPNREVRLAARSALARLGERQALQGFRQALSSQEPHHVHEAVQTIASEGLTLLWPDLDRLVDAEDLDVANHAREALERLCEDLDRRPV